MLKIEYFGLILSYPQDLNFKQLLLTLLIQVLCIKVWLDSELTEQIFDYTKSIFLLVFYAVYFILFFFVYVQNFLIQYFFKFMQIQFANINSDRIENLSSLWLKLSLIDTTQVSFSLFLVLQDFQISCPKLIQKSHIKSIFQFQKILHAHIQHLYGSVSIVQHRSDGNYELHLKSNYLDVIVSQNFKRCGLYDKKCNICFFGFSLHEQLFLSIRILIIVIVLLMHLLVDEGQYQVCLNVINIHKTLVYAQLIM